jgi:plastocyanin
MKRFLFCGRTRNIIALLILICACRVARATTWEVTMEGDDRFHPSTLNIVQGDSVSWRNTAVNGHTSTSGAATCVADGVWNSGTLTSGQTWGRVFHDAGTFDYFCSIHCDLGMIGSIIVQANSASEARTWGQIRAIYR